MGKWTCPTGPPLAVSLITFNKGIRQWGQSVSSRLSPLVIYIPTKSETGDVLKYFFIHDT